MQISPKRNKTTTTKKTKTEINRSISQKKIFEKKRKFFTDLYKKKKR